MLPPIKIIIFEFFVLIEYFLFIISILGILVQAHRKIWYRLMHILQLKYKYIWKEHWLLPVEFFFQIIECPSSSDIFTYDYVKIKKYIFYQCFSVLLCKVVSFSVSLFLFLSFPVFRFPSFTVSKFLSLLVSQFISSSVS